MAIEKFNSNEVIGAPSKVEKFVSSKNRVVVKTNIFIRNFPKSFTEEQVKEFLINAGSQFGKITSLGCDKKELPNNPPSFSGFVALSDEENANNFIEKFNGLKLPEHAEE